MSCLQGYIHTSYNALVRVFGAPMRDGDKSSVEWCVDGKDVYIYDYKSFCPQNDTVFEFHVGGNDIRDVRAVITALRAAGEQVR